MVWTFKWSLFSSSCTWYYLFCTKFWLLSLLMKSYGVTIQMKPLQQYFHMVLLVLSVVPTFESVYEIVVWPFKWNLFCSSFTWNHLSFSIVQKKIWKFFVVLFSSWSLLKSGRVSLRVQHISKLKKNAIKWPGYFTLSCSPQTDLKMNFLGVYLLKLWFFLAAPCNCSSTFKPNWFCRC